MNNTQHEVVEPRFYGATYSTDPGPDFGRITSVFEVEADWDGYRFHGYCRATPEEFAEYFGA
jgi:hypothetical protein